MAIRGGSVGLVFLQSAESRSVNVSLSSKRNKKSVAMLPGSTLVLTREDCLHLIAEEPLDLVGLTISTTFIDRLSPTANEQLRLRVREAQRPRIVSPLASAAVSAAIDGIAAAGDHASLVIEGTCAALIGTVLQQLDGNNADECAFSEADKKAIVDFFEANMQANVSSADIAARLGLRPTDFQQLFKRSFGTTPKRFMTDLRLSRARQLIVNTDDDLAGIATECGFCDQSHLTNTMKRYSGETPGALRTRFARANAPLNAAKTDSMPYRAA